MDLNLVKIKYFFDSLAETWDNNNLDTNGAKKIVAAFKTNIANMNVLDVGCGTGVLYPTLKKANAKSITAIDISDKMINNAKKKFPDGNFICEDILKFHPKNKFDTVIMYNVYPHLNNKAALVSKINELLNTNGVFIVAHGSSRESINSHHQAHAMGVSQKLLKANEEAEIWKPKFDITVSRDNDLYYFCGKKKDK